MFFNESNMGELKVLARRLSLASSAIGVVRELREEEYGRATILTMSIVPLIIEEINYLSTLEDREHESFNKAWKDSFDSYDDEL